MKIFNYILLLISLPFITLAQEHKAKLYKTKRFEAAIFPAEYKDLLPELRFTPTFTEVDMAEKALEEELKKLNSQLINQSDSPVIHKKIDKYCRQYFGYIDNNGDRILLINCFWKKNQENYKRFQKSWIIVYDGGSYYWNVKYNLDTGELFDLNVNGYG